MILKASKGPAFSLCDNEMILTMLEGGPEGGPSWQVLSTHCMLGVRMRRETVRS